MHALTDQHKQMLREVFRGTSTPLIVTDDQLTQMVERVMRETSWEVLREDTTRKESLEAIRALRNRLEKFSGAGERTLAMLTMADSRVHKVPEFSDEDDALSRQDATTAIMLRRGGQLEVVHVGEMLLRIQRACDQASKGEDLLKRDALRSLVKIAAHIYRTATGKRPTVTPKSEGGTFASFVHILLDIAVPGHDYTGSLRRHIEAAMR